MMFDAHDEGWESIKQCMKLLYSGEWPMHQPSPIRVLAVRAVSLASAALCVFTACSLPVSRVQRSVLKALHLLPSVTTYAKCQQTSAVTRIITATLFAYHPHTICTSLTHYSHTIPLQVGGGQQPVCV